MQGAIWEEPSVEAIAARVDRFRPGQMHGFLLLAAAQLCLLGGMNNAVIDEDVWTWWRMKSRADRFALATAGLNQLKRMKLVDEHVEVPRDGNLVGAGSVGPALAIMLTARSNPAFVALFRDADGTSDMRAYGVPDSAGHTSMVLLENRGKPRTSLGAMYGYVICNREGGTAAMANWLDDAPEEVDGDRPAARTIDLYLARASSPMHRVTAARAAADLQVTHTVGTREPAIRHGMSVDTVRAILRTVLFGGSDDD
ncbi:hypothetical protein BIV57_12645 [Mangrovactinospora gilvigrisea]|uniref:Uncharacterized protein n=1 Tax=Mangrovactinospora gilvigrisea TaxID=1428644 RepID=A0A1J7CBY2_9ACTN|nr:hypothetical protein [Mangrovactinospora gilvigrisea]OIV37170.1 hypothetical protein BIV57_12645 [Mangrovactinospora gilvigrisea]